VGCVISYSSEANVTSYKKKTVCVIDNGLFVTWAGLLAKDFGTVYYTSPWESSYPKSNAMLIGHGMEGVKRINDIWSVFDQVDLWVFPDVYSGALQIYLEGLGERVWGCRMAEQLELDRVGSKELCAKVGIDIGPYTVIDGLDNLRDFLKENDNQYVKISATRGDMETFYSKNYRLIEPRLNELGHSVGAKGSIMKFIVEQALDPAIETGYDGYCIDGQYPKTAMFGIEVKDKGYLLQTESYDDLPEQVRSVNDKLSPIFEACRMRGFWSSEIRVTPDCTGYLIDPCPRAGSPPSELYQILVSNWADIMYEGSVGNMVQPKFTAKWGAELLMMSEWADKNWQAVEFPPEIRDNVKLYHCCVIDGRHYVAPQWTGHKEIGAVVATGDSQEEAIENCRAIAEQVEGHYVSFDFDSLDEASDQLAALGKLNGG
jgi:hypothetical protein